MGSWSPLSWGLGLHVDPAMGHGVCQMLSPCDFTLLSQLLRSLSPLGSPPPPPHPCPHPWDILCTPSKRSSRLAHTSVNNPWVQSPQIPSLNLSVHCRFPCREPSRVWPPVFAEQTNA